MRVGETGFKKRKYDFSLDFLVFGPSVLVGPRSKVDLRYKGNVFFKTCIRTLNFDICFGKE